MDLDRRALFAAGGIAFVGASGARGAEITPYAPGITVQLRYHNRTWEVLVPDLREMEKVPPIEGLQGLIRWIPLDHFLGVMDGTT